MKKFIAVTLILILTFMINYKSTEGSEPYAPIFVDIAQNEAVEILETLENMGVVHAQYENGNIYVLEHQLDFVKEKWFVSTSISYDDGKDTGGQIQALKIIDAFAAEAKDNGFKDVAVHGIERLDHEKSLWRISFDAVLESDEKRENIEENSHWTEGLKRYAEIHGIEEDTDEYSAKIIGMPYMKH